MAVRAKAMSTPETADNIYFTAMSVQAGRQDRLVMLIHIGSEGAMGYAIMALFSAGAAPKLLDAANVSDDRMHRLPRAGRHLGRQWRKWCW